MKSKDFNRKPNSLRVLEEFKPKRNKYNWDRIIYLGVLLLTLGYMVYKFSYKYLMVTAEGQVLFKKLDIQFTDDVEIKHFLTKEGDEVNIGDSLFYYLNEKAKSKSTSKTKQVLTENDRDTWTEKELIQTKKKIELALINIAEARRIKGQNMEEKNRVQKAVYLDLYHADKLDIYFQRDLKLDNEINTNIKEIEYLKEYLLLLKDRLNTDRITKQTVVESSSGPHYDHVYRSPVDGVITRILKENYEVALESEVIMSIHKPSNLYIKAFFSPEDVTSIEEGDLVNVIFPDGTESIGILQRFYSATFKLPAEFQKKYEPVTRTISADIIPLNDIELEKWRPFYKLSLKVTKSKIPFFNLL